MNAANEVAVEEFLKEGISFMKIPEVVERVMRRHMKIADPGIKDIREADSWARQEALKFIRRSN